MTLAQTRAGASAGDWTAVRDPTGREAVEFRLAAPARPVTGALWEASTAAGAPLVLMGHGASGDRYQAPICHLARRFNDEAGAHVLAIDGPVHGLRQVGEGGRAAFAVEARRADFIDDMLADWGAALDAVRSRVEVTRVGYFGLSMGSIFGVPLVAARSEIAAAALGLLGVDGAGGAFARRLLADAGRIECPVLFLVQLEDELFPREGCLRLFDAFASADKRLHANPGLHPQVPAEEVAFAFDFLRRSLAEEGGGRTAERLAE